MQIQIRLLTDQQEDPEFFQGDQIAVREVNKRNGETVYGVYRPWDKKKHVLKEFPCLEYANTWGYYIEVFCNGHMDSHYRKEATAFADKEA